MKTKKTIFNEAIEGVLSGRSSDQVLLEVAGSLLALGGAYLAGAHQDSIKRAARGGWDYLNTPKVPKGLEMLMHQYHAGYAMHPGLHQQIYPGMNSAHMSRYAPGSYPEATHPSLYPYGVMR